MEVAADRLVRLPAGSPPITHIQLLMKANSLRARDSEQESEQDHDHHHRLAVRSGRFAYRRVIHAAEMTMLS